MPTPGSFPSAYINPPDGVELPGFPGTYRTKAKTGNGAGKKRRRWKDRDGMIYEWDYQHGTVEVWSPNGHRHLGDFDYMTGRRVGAADPSRRPVEP